MVIIGPTRRDRGLGIDWEFFCDAVEMSLWGFSEIGHACMHDRQISMDGGFYIHLHMHVHVHGHIVIGNGSGVFRVVLMRFIML